MFPKQKHIKYKHRKLRFQTSNFSSSKPVAVMSVRYKNWLMG